MNQTAEMGRASVVLVPRARSIESEPFPGKPRVAQYSQCTV